MARVNNDFYDDLGERWFEGDDHAISLLRREGLLKTAYALRQLRQHGIEPGASVLDVACGAGLISIPLARAGYHVEGVDLAEGALAVARERVPEGTTATFRTANALDLDVPDASVDAVLLLDMLEHVDRPDRAIAEAARVVRPGGLVLFSTFNQTPLAWLVAVHGFRFVVRDAPKHIHVWDLFIPPDTLRGYATDAGLAVDEIRGMRPVVNAGLVRSVLRRRLDPDFQFTLSNGLAVGYIGAAVRES